MTSAQVMQEPALKGGLKHLASDFRSSLDAYLQYEKGNSNLNDRYCFQSNLQTGSFGKVTAAIDLQRNQLVAVKALKKSIQGVRSMANHEVAIMKFLGYHPNICQLLDVFETKKYIILVLEYVPCGDLYDAIHNKTSLGMAFQSDAKMFSSLCQQLYSVIKFTHEKGVFHRDIKPENILLMRDGTIKLCDWGLATQSTKCNDFNVGTEKYMAPEAFDDYNDESFYDATLVDTWSIGITLLYTLFNKCPFRKANTLDSNYSSFIENKNFIFDLYQNISTASFSGIIDKLLIERNLDDAMSFLINTGVKKGYNINQEYMINFNDRENRFINYINNQASSSAAANESNSFPDDLFMFDDDEDNVNDDFENNSSSFELKLNNNVSQQSNLMNSFVPLQQQQQQQSFDHRVNYFTNCNVEPISIPAKSSTISATLTSNNNNGKNNSQGNGNTDNENTQINESISYSYKNTNSLFDKNTLNSINTTSSTYFNNQSYINSHAMFNKNGNFF